MNVYIVTREYQYRWEKEIYTEVIGVYSTKEKAEQARQQVVARDEYETRHVSIEESTLDAEIQ
jgi:hypothetical protein